MSEFEWPWEYNFPPFFTIQVNSETRVKQMRAWRSLVLAFCTFHKLYSLDVNDAILNSPLFNNRSINRSLTKDGLLIVLDDLQKEGFIEWQDGTKSKCFIHWKTPEEWSKLIYNHVIENGLKGSVCTFYELTEADEVSSKPFYQLHQDILKKSLSILEKQGRAAVIRVGDTEGVKFL